MHSVAGELLGSITYDNRETIGPANARKQELEEEKAKIYDSQRTARANQDAIK